MEIRRAKTHKAETKIKVISLSEELDKTYFTEEYVEKWKNKQNQKLPTKSTITSSEALPLHKEFESLAENESNSQLKLRLEKIAQGFKNLGL